MPKNKIEFNKTTQQFFVKKLLTFIKSSIEDISLKTGGDINLLVDISKINLIKALDEIKKDIKILNFRRNPKSGVSQSKLAGIILFRLMKHPVIQPSKKEIDNKDLVNINILTALNFAVSVIMKIDERHFKRIDKHILQELVYTSVYRHTNQETLGIVFQSIA